MGVKQGNKTDGITLESEGENYGPQLLSSLCSWSYFSEGNQSSNSVLICIVADIHSLPPYFSYLQLIASLEMVGSSVLKF